MKPYTADQLLNDTMADLEEKPPRRKKLPKADDIRCGPTDEGLAEIAAIAGEMQRMADRETKAGYSLVDAVVESWSKRLLKASRSPRVQVGMEITHLLDAREAANVLRMSASRVVRLAKNGGIPSVLLPDGEYRFDGADLSAWIESHKQPVRGGAHA